jgi:hypothetical protein
MSNTSQGGGEAKAVPQAEPDRQLGVLLLCFDTITAAAAARRPLDRQLKSVGDAVIDTVVLRVDSKSRASVHDPRRVVQGTLTALLTWGVFGAVTSGLQGLVIWGVLGAICGGGYAYYSEHLLAKSELAHIGRRLPAGSSALVTYAETRDPRRLLAATATLAPTAASAVAINDDLSARGFGGAANPVELPDGPGGAAAIPGGATALSMILLRYPGVGTARQVASREAATSTKHRDPVQVELVVWVDPDGRRHVADPSQGVRAWAVSDTISWGGFGLVVGAIAGAVGGGGLHGLVSQGLVTGIGWALFGLVAGALYGLWAGRGESARRLKGLGGLLVPGSSMVVAWTEGAATTDVTARLTATGAKRLVVRFDAVEGGAVLAAA